MSQPQNSSTLMDAALSYAANGFFVFPTHDVTGGTCSCKQACDSPGKHPRTLRGLHDATTDPVKVLEWWRKWPTANIAIDCGRSGVAVADVDVKKGAQGEAAMRWFLERSEAFQKTFLVASPTGGYHFYLKGALNIGKAKLAPGIDLQSVGRYVLAPPSVAFSQYDEVGAPVLGSQRPYSVVRPAPLLDFPLELLPGEQPAVDPDTIDFSAREFSGAERDAVPYGEHRQSLLWLGWHLRSVQGLSVEAGLVIMRGFLNALDGYNPKRPFSDRELRDMLIKVKPNIAAQPPPNSATLLESIVPASVTISQRYPIRQHFVPGLILQGELHVFYGDTGVGKTTLIARALADISRQGRDVLVFINEDRPRDFDITYHLSGGDLNRLYNHRAEVKELLLPKCTPELEQLIASRQWGAIYFDSVGDIDATEARDHAGNRARKLYGPLSSLAQRYNVAIICTIHINKAGVFEGSQQIKAKSRVFAKVTRPKADMNTDTIDFTATSASWTSVVTTEKFQRGKSGARYSFFFNEFPSVDPYTGEVDQEMDQHGNLKPVMQYVCTGYAEMPPEASAADAAENDGPRPDLRAKVEEIWRAEPGISGNKIVERIGGRRSDIYKILRDLQGEKKNEQGTASVSDSV